MALFEFILLVLIFTTLLLNIIPVSYKNAPFIYAAAAAAAIPLSILAAGARWQMFPAYALTAALFIVGIIRIFQKTAGKKIIKSKAVRVVVSVMAVFIFAFSAALPALLPVVDLPFPEGGYPVGTTSLRLTDNGRSELFTQDENDVRDMVINVWYPAKAESDETKASYWDENGIIGKEYSENSGMGMFWYTHLSNVKTAGALNADVSAKKEAYPVIIYSPSFYGLNRENTILFQELASLGYIVMSINHPYETIVSLYPDGSCIKGDLEYILSQYDTNEEAEKKLYDAFYAAKSYDEKKDAAYKILSADKSDAFMIEQRAMDAVYLLDELERLNSGSGMFSSKLDLEKIGMIGWSYGGATTVEAMLKDDRIKAGINIDGWPYGAEFSAGNSITQPFMVIRSGDDDEIENVVSDIIYEKMSGPSYFVKVSGASHMNFWDFPLFFKVYSHLGYWESIDPITLKSITSSLADAFFGKYLCLKSTDIENISDAYLETELVQKNTD